MRLAEVKGTVTATVKAERLVGEKLMLLDLIDAEGQVQEAGHVAPDTVGAGPGDRVLVTTGSAARMASGLGSAPVDLAIIAIVDRVTA